MTTEKERVDRLVSELSMVEFESGRLLDDDSLRLIAEVRCRNLLTDDEWTQIKQFLKKALTFLSGPEKTLTYANDGHPVINPDADPRNADWIRIAAACRLANRDLPMWAALWLWWLRTDTSPVFWRKVGEIADRLGYPKKFSEFVLEESSEVILEIGAEGGSITLYGIPHDNKWRYFASVNELMCDEVDKLEYPRDSGYVDSWHAALRLIDRYPWHRLYALTAHPQFKARIWTAVQRRFARDKEPDHHALERWRELCSRKP
jgi:hypothetical protein